MTRDVVTVGPDTPIERLCDIFRERKITGAPVVDADGRLVGIVSKDDIIFRARGQRPEEPEPDIKSLFSSGFVGFAQNGAGASRVSEIMTRDVLSASEDVAIGELCRMMWEKRVHRVPIVKGERLVGIVSALDLCKTIANGTLSDR